MALCAIDTHHEPHGPCEGIKLGTIQEEVPSQGHLLVVEEEEVNDMADGDFTIPTYLASPGGGCCGHHGRDRGGLEGKDATLIHALQDDRAHAEGTRETRDEGRFILRALADERQERERDFRELALELSNARCELKEKIHHEGEKTRDLIRDFRQLDQAAEIACLKAKLLALTPPPTPPVS